MSQDDFISTRKGFLIHIPDQEPTNADFLFPLYIEPLTRDEIQSLISIYSNVLSDKRIQKKYKEFSTVKHRTEFLSEYMPRVLTKWLDLVRKKGLMNPTKELGLSYKVEKNSFTLALKGEVIYETRNDHFNNQDEFKDFVLDFFKNLTESMNELIEKTFKGEREEENAIIDAILNKDKPGAESTKERYLRVINNLVSLKEIRISLIKSILSEITSNFSDDIWEGEYETIPYIEKGKLVLRDGKPVFKRTGGGLLSKMVKLGAKKEEGERLNIEWMDKLAFKQHMIDLLEKDVIRIPKTEQELLAEEEVLKAEIADLDYKLSRFNQAHVEDKYGFAKHHSSEQRAESITRLMNFILSNLGPTLSNIVDKNKLISRHEWEWRPIQFILDDPNAYVCIIINRKVFYERLKYNACRMNGIWVAGRLQCENFKDGFISTRNRDDLGEYEREIINKFPQLLLDIEQAIMKIIKEAAFGTGAKTLKKQFAFQIRDETKFFDEGEGVSSLNIMAVLNSVDETKLLEELKGLVRPESTSKPKSSAPPDSEGLFALGTGMKSFYVGAFTKQESEFLQSIFYQKNLQITKNTLFLLHNKVSGLVSKSDVHLFSGSSEIGTYRIDVNPKLPATHLITVQDFLKFCKKNNIFFDLIVLDPPYNAKFDAKYGTTALNHIADDNKFLAWLVDGCLDILSNGGLVISKNWRSIRPRDSRFISGMVSFYGGFRRATLMETWEYAEKDSPFHFSWRKHAADWNNAPEMTRWYLGAKGKWIDEEIKQLVKLGIGDAGEGEVLFITRKSSNPFPFGVKIATPEEIAMNPASKYKSIILDDCEKIGAAVKLTVELKKKIIDSLQDGGYAITKTYFDPTLGLRLLSRAVILYDNYEKIDLFTQYKKEEEVDGDEVEIDRTASVGGLVKSFII